MKKAHKWNRRALAWALALAMVCGLLPAAAQEQGETPAQYIYDFIQAPVFGEAVGDAQDPDNMPWFFSGMSEGDHGQLVYYDGYYLQFNARSGSKFEAGEYVAFTLEIPAEGLYSVAATLSNNKYCTNQAEIFLAPESAEDPTADAFRVKAVNNAVPASGDVENDLGPLWLDAGRQVLTFRMAAGSGYYLRLKALRLVRMDAELYVYNLRQNFAQGQPVGSADSRNNMPWMWSGGNLALTCTPNYAQFGDSNARFGEGAFLRFELEAPAAGLYDLAVLTNSVKWNANQVAVYCAPAGAEEPTASAYYLSTLDTSDTAEQTGEAVHTFSNQRLKKGRYAITLLPAAGSGYFLQLRGFWLTRTGELPDPMTIRAEGPEAVAAGCTAAYALSGTLDGAETSLMGAELEATSGNPQIASAEVRREGSAAFVDVAGISAGSADITVTAAMDGETATAIFSVRVGAAGEVAQVSLKAEQANLAIGDTVATSLTGVRLDGGALDLSQAQVSYESLQPEVLSVDSRGTVTALAMGEGEIRATVRAGGAERSAQLRLTVSRDPLASLSIEGGQALEAGGRRQYAVRGRYRSGEERILSAEDGEVRFVQISCAPLDGAAVSGSGLVQTSGEAVLQIRAEAVDGAQTVVSDPYTIYCLRMDTSANDVELDFSSYHGGGISPAEVELEDAGVAGQPGEDLAVPDRAQISELRHLGGV